MQCVLNQFWIWIRVILLIPFCQIGSKRESRNSSFGKIRRYNYLTRHRSTTCYEDNIQAPLFPQRVSIVFTSSCLIIDMLYIISRYGRNAMFTKKQREVWRPMGLFLDTILIIWYNSACFEVNCVYYQVYRFQIIIYLRSLLRLHLYSKGKVMSKYFKNSMEHNSCY